MPKITPASKMPRVMSSLMNVIHCNNLWTFLFINIVVVFLITCASVLFDNSLFCISKFHLPTVKAAEYLKFYSYTRHPQHQHPTWFPCKIKFENEHNITHRCKLSVMSACIKSNRWFPLNRFQSNWKEKKMQSTAPSYRSISLLNADVKILSKVLAARVNTT